MIVRSAWSVDGGPGRMRRTVARELLVVLSDELGHRVKDPGIRRGARSLAFDAAHRLQDELLGEQRVEEG